MRFASFFFLATALSCLLFSFKNSAVQAQIAPGIISTDDGTVTLTESTILNGDFLFLWSGNSDCTLAPAYSASTEAERTAVHNSGADTQVSGVDVSKLNNDTYYLCHSTTGVFPASYSSLGTLRALHTTFMSPSTLNIDQKNVSVTMQHVTVGNSIFLLKTMVGGVPTKLDCNNYNDPGGISLENRSHIVRIHGDLTAMLMITHLTTGEYDICYSMGAFVNQATTTFARLPQRVHLIRTKLCLGGGASGICLVSPTYTDKRLGFDNFTLYPARPRTWAYLLRKERCGAATYTCATGHDAALEAEGFMSPLARVNFDRSIDVNISNLLPGASYVFCHKNSSSENPPSFLPWNEVTAATLSVSGGIDPSQTVVSCCGTGNTFVAGTSTWCMIYTYDISGLPSGIPGDTCQLVGQALDPNGNSDQCVSRTYHRDVGKFEISFVGKVAGYNTLSIHHFNFSSTGASTKATVAKIGTRVKISAAAFDEANSISNCSNSGGTDSCTITNRDAYGNYINTCTILDVTESKFCNEVAFP